MFCCCWWGFLSFGVQYVVWYFGECCLNYVQFSVWFVVLFVQCLFLVLCVWLFGEKVQGVFYYVVEWLFGFYLCGYVGQICFDGFVVVDSLGIFFKYVMVGGGEQVWFLIGGVVNYYVVSLGEGLLCFGKRFDVIVEYYG